MTNFSSVLRKRWYRSKTWLPGVKDPCCLQRPWTGGHRDGSRKYHPGQHGQGGAAQRSWSPSDTDRTGLWISIDTPRMPRCLLPRAVSSRDKIIVAFF